MDAAIVKQMGSIRWNYGDKDAAATAELLKRIVSAARKRDLITYSDLVVGVTFQLPNVNNGRPFQVDVHNWSHLDRAIAGEFLGYISTQSYRTHGFMASALVVDRMDRTPSMHFFKWMQDLGILPDTTEDTVLEFWIDQVNLAHDHYAPRRR